MKSFNDNFQIAFKSKSLLINLYNLMENIPRKDYYFKDKINETTYDLLKTIYLANHMEDSFKQVHSEIKCQISLLDFLLEILYNKKYISLKQLEKHIYVLTEINKMTTSWLANRELRDE